MKAILILSAIIIAGCGNAVDQACRPYTNIDSATILSWARADMENGYSYSDEIMVLQQSCAGDAACLACGTAAINQVYGR